MSKSYDGMVDATYRGLTLDELLAAPVEALTGLSAADAEHLRAAFGIRTIGELGRSPFLRRAAALADSRAAAHDPGPPPDWAQFFAAAPLAHYQNHPDGRFRLHFGPVYYRGRLDGTARVIVIGQDPSTNEILAHRILIGHSGQLVQRFLAKIGLTRSYVMVNAFLYSVFGQFDSELQGIAEEAVIRDYRNALLDRIAAANGIQAVVTFGRGARHAFEQWPGGAAHPVFHAMHPSADEGAVIANWNLILPQVRAAVDPDDDGVVDLNPLAPTFALEGATPIPRFDLPFGMPEWHGRDGGNSTRDGDDKIVWNAP